MQLVNITVEGNAKANKLLLHLRNYILESLDFGVLFNLYLYNKRFWTSNVILKACSIEFCNFKN